VWNMRGGKRRKGEKQREKELIVEVAPELSHFHTLHWLVAAKMFPTTQRTAISKDQRK